jgi:hypothetical protein
MKPYPPGPAQRARIAKLERALERGDLTVAGRHDLEQLQALAAAAPPTQGGREGLPAIVREATPPAGKGSDDGRSVSQPLY